MSRSNAPRERLLKPWHLALAVIGFVAAFVWIAPAKQALTLENNEVELGIDDLELAYLKAERASSQQSSDDVIKAATALVRSQRIDEAEELLAERPDIRLSSADELALSIERSFVLLNNAIDQKTDDVDVFDHRKNSLIVEIDKVNQSKDINQVGLLKRSQEIAVWLEERELAGDLSLRLATQDATNAHHWLLECRNQFTYLGQFEKALLCANRRIDNANSDQQLFDAKLDVLTLNARLGNQPRVNQLANNLLNSSADDAISLESMAERLLAVERPLDASRAYEKLASVDESNSVQWLNMAAKWAEAGGKPDIAAAYLDLSKPSLPSQEHSKLDDEIARLLTAAGDSNALLARMESKIVSGDTSLSTLQSGIKAALGNNQLPLARQWNELLIQNYPDNVEGWVNQYDISLANTELDAAMAAAKTLVDLEPDSADFHMRLARVAEWNGDPDLATSEWLWLSERYPSLETLTELTRLATLTRRPTIAAEALRQKAMRKKPTRDQVNELVIAYELEGRPDLAAKVLNTLIARYGNDAHIMQRLANLHHRHVDFPAAATTWERYESVHGRTVLSHLHLMEMRWRVGKSTAANAYAEGLLPLVGNNTRSLDVASQYQVRLLAEIAWRYSNNELSALAEPLLVKIDETDEQVLQRQRSISLAEKQGNLDKAIKAAEILYEDTLTSESALIYMRLLIEGVRLGGELTSGYDDAIKPFLVGNNDTVELRQLTRYWSMVAQYHLTKGDKKMAERAYRSALGLSARNPDVLSGLLWMYVGSDNSQAMKEVLETHSELIEQSPVLWTPVAMAHLQLGQPVKSLRWFERQIDSISSDYSLLLTYADALESSGRAEHAYRVRNYAIEALRPLLVESASADKDELLQQYARMVARFGDSDQKERFTQGVIADKELDSPSTDKFWQQEMAISWLMATQRHDLARVVLAKLHESRLEAPAWQALAVAMKQNDLDVVAQIVQDGSGISVGDNLLALRQIGRGDDAFELAVKSLQAGLSGSDGRMAAETYRSLKAYRPAFAGASVISSSAPEIGVIESSILARYTFPGSTLGISVDASRERFSSSRYLIDETDDRSDVSVSLHYGDIGFNTRLTAGYISDKTDDRTYVSGAMNGRFGNNKHGYYVELAMNETPTASSLLRLRGKQNRASANVDMTLGTLGFVKLGADITDIQSRVAERRVARGLSGLAEIGLRGTMGSHSWTSSVLASTASNDREESVFDEFLLNDSITVNEVIGKSFSTVSMGASLSRGNIAENYPQVSSPRYYLNGRVGHSWPSKSFGVQFDAGAGVRIFGGDELSIGFSHDGLLQDLVDDGRSRLGVNYRFHF